MKAIRYIIPVLMLCTQVAGAQSLAEVVRVENSFARQESTRLRLDADIILDDLKLGSSKQIYITPVISDGEGNQEVLPAVLVNGRAMQIAYERRSIGGNAAAGRDLSEVVRRRNGKAQTVDYHASISMEKWMWSPSTSVSWVIDSCGCGHLYGSRTGDPVNLGLNPAERMRVAYMTPAVTPLPISVHQGEAKVLFEVNKSVLHTEPYICKNGQRIDNAPELKVIDDSVSMAIKDENVEIAKIRICGYASPEGPYLNNQSLSTDRSRALALYLGDRYKLPAGSTEYDAVPENWAGLRAIVEKTPDLSVTQRAELLELIDRPAYGPADYDAKDRELKTDPRFAKLYREVILPQWYPGLRVTKFEISTRLRPLSDEQLAVVLEHTPEKMTLNQMFRVAMLYPEGSDEFNRVIEVALKHFPDDPTANLNAAMAAVKNGDLDRASALLERVVDSPEAENARGVIATFRGDIDAARTHFNNAAPLPEAAKNLEMLGK